MDIGSLFNMGMGYFGREIGSFGDIVFEVSSLKVKTLDGYSRDTTVRLASHDVIGKKPVIEYIGPGTDSIKFTMKFNKFWGVNPEEEVESVRQMAQTGQAAYLIIGGKPLSDYKFIIESVSETIKAWDKSGNVINAQIDITAKEYPENIPATMNDTTNEEGADSGNV